MEQVFYGPSVLPAIQPPMSKHKREHKVLALISDWSGSHSKPYAQKFYWSRLPVCFKCHLWWCTHDLVSSVPAFV